MPLIPDEATRSLVSLEMDYSGNLLAPTINGEYYFNKPPLYNWMLLTVFRLGNSASELLVRLPVVFFLLLYGLIIYVGFRSHLGEQPAFVTALAYVTSGRLLFYDSMLGLIDMSFSLLIFLNFMQMYHFIKSEKYTPLFLLSYLIAAAGFLLKGLPAVVFQGISLLAAFLFFKRFKELFSIRHLAGIFIFVFLIGGYYFAVWQENPTMEYFNTLLNESGKRTFFEYGLPATLKHIILFPAEQLYHLFPWSVVLLYLFRKDFYKTLRKNEFLSFIAILFLANISVYWLSPETYPRYLFMLYPLLLGMAVSYHFSLKDTKQALFSLTEKILFILIGLSLIAVIGGRFVYPFEGREPSWLIILGTAFFLSCILLLWQKNKIQRLELLILSLLILRISFNLVVIPERLQASPSVKLREQAIEAGQLTRNEELKLLPWTGISHESSFYISRERKQILMLTDPPVKPGICYITSDEESLHTNEELLYRFETRYKNKKLRIVRITK